ncbi:interleukin-5 receptor subunit alpha isoform X2 [Amia ocellicauda]|uniref:interleukin-5 receptor subunit alpha isoform X2 n=1 Tax=Amia ocellicauda TaxID=2972642 RepID=UPI0034644814
MSTAANGSFDRPVSSIRSRKCALNPSHLESSMHYSVTLMFFFQVVWNSADCSEFNSANLLPPTNFKISEHCGFVNFSWDKCEGKNVEYMLRYRYLNDKQFNKKTTKNTSARRYLDVQKGILGQVQCVFKIDGKNKTESNWTEIRNFMLSKDRGYLSDNISCIVYNYNQSKCTWKKPENMPEHAQYSMTAVQYITSTKVKSAFECLTKEEDNVIECFGKVKRGEATVRLQISVPSTDFCYTFSYTFSVSKFEKLGPPQNIKASVNSRNLEITWDPAPCLSTENENCFEYDIIYWDKDNIFEVNKLKKNHYSVTYIDLTKTYCIKIRTHKSDNCEVGKASDWSETVEVKATVNKFNIVVIAIMSVVIPSLILAILLFFRCQRVLDRILPPIPGPTLRIKHLIEKDFIFQVEAPKCVEEVIEVQGRI